MTKPDTLKLQVTRVLCCLSIFHMGIWDTQNKLKSPQDRKESVYIVKEAMAKEDIK